MTAMIEGLLLLILTTAIFVGPLVWRTRRDRAQDRALALTAEIRSAVNHALGGESLVSVNVEPPGHGQPGRVMVSTPSGCEGLIETAWRAVLARLPRNYELVITTVGAAPLRPCAELTSAGA